MCDSKLLAALSTFYEDKIAGHKNFGNKLEFEYEDFDVEVIGAFLDSCYSIESFQDGLNLCQKLQLMKFLFYEGKNQTSGKG